VGVEGPSDRAFWDKVLHKHFPSARFDIRNMKNREKLVRETPSLLESFRDFHYAAGFILVDRNSSPCAAAVVNEFDAAIQEETRKPLDERFLFVCVAIRELEAWYLADGPAIGAVLPKVSWDPPKETGNLNAEKQLKKLWITQNGQIAAFNKIDFAKQIAPKFNPNQAEQHSASFSYFWKYLTSKSRR
jgi:hypothetical protein